MITNSPDGALTHGTNLIVRSESFGAVSGGGGGFLSRRQQQVRDSAVPAQQHRPAVAQVRFSFTPSRSRQGPLARVTGANPVVTMATTNGSVVTNFSGLRSLNMASIRGQSIHCPSPPNDCPERIESTLGQRRFRRWQKIDADCLTNPREGSRQLS